MNSPNSTTNRRSAVPMSPTIASLCLRNLRQISEDSESWPGLRRRTREVFFAGCVSVTSDGCAMRVFLLAEAEADARIQPGQSDVRDEGADYRERAEGHGDRYRAAQCME